MQKLRLLDSSVFASRMMCCLFAALVALVALVASGASGAHAQEPAQEPVRLALFPASSSDAALEELASALNTMVLSRLSEISQVQVAAQPALDLSATLLAADCIGETKQCLVPLTEQAGVDALLAPSVQRAGDETVVTLLYADARGDAEIRNVTRRYGGQDDVAKQALDAIPAMLDELLGIAPVPAPQPPRTDYDESREPPAAKPFPVLPVVVTAVGVALVGGGIAFGLMAKASEDDYAALPVTSMSEADKAADELSSAQTQALISNIGLIAGGAVTALGVTLLVLHFTDESDSERASLMPTVAPGELGLTLRGQL